MVDKAVVLVAGKSTRTFPLTATKPKALLKVANQRILSHILDALEGKVKEVIFVVHYKKEMIQELYGSNYKSMKIIYVEQKETNGTGHALLQAEEAVGKAHFIVIVGDDYFDKRDIEILCKQKRALLAQEVEHPELYGVVNVNEKNELLVIDEKPTNPKSKLVNTACYVMDAQIFQYLKKLKKSKRGEYELTDAVTVWAKQEPFVVIKAQYWQPITYPWNLLDANKKLLSQIKFKNEGKIEQGVTIHGTVQIGKGTILKSGTYIEGPVIIGENCRIGPNCYIRPDTTLGNSVKVGNAVEVKNSIVGDSTSIGHLSYVGDSVIGDHVNFGAGTIVANLRHDDTGIKSEVNGKLMDSGRRKLGTIIGDNVHTGIHTSIYPGRKLWPNTTTVPGEIVKKDKNIESKQAE